MSRHAKDWTRSSAYNIHYMATVNRLGDLFLYGTIEKQKEFIQLSVDRSELVCD
jgi:hypothetical protein